MAQSQYIPGVCNIGPAEIQMRRNLGYVGALLTLALWTVFILLRVPPVWRLTLFLPAFLSANGFFQAALHFCSGFAMAGVFNFGAKVGDVIPVAKSTIDIQSLGVPDESGAGAEFKRKDRQKALQISLFSVLVGVGVALVGFFLFI